MGMGLPHLTGDVVRLYENRETGDLLTMRDSNKKYCETRLCCDQDTGIIYYFFENESGEIHPLTPYLSRKGEPINFFEINGNLENVK